MKIKMLETASGDTTYKKGQVYEIPDAKAQRWIAARRAVAVEEPKKADKKK
jgi:hypothetical protein